MIGEKRIRNDDWKSDEDLQATLQDYVGKRWRLSLILNYMERDFSQYAWSEGTLKRRLSFFGIKYINKNVTVLDIAAAVVDEINGTGTDLGFRPMTQKLREKHLLKVPERKVLEVMHAVDPNGVERRGNVGMKKKVKRNEAFLSPVNICIIYLI